LRQIGRSRLRSDLSLCGKSPLLVLSPSDSGCIFAPFHAPPSRISMLDQAIAAYYSRGEEEKRLEGADFPLERIRTQLILRRVLPPPPATVLDVGGAAGVYAYWLADLGYRVHLVDPVPLHIEQARAAGRSGPTALASLGVGDAKKLDFADGSADAVLLLGPLYHLTERADRVAALREARRVTGPDGVVVAAAISRFASLLDGLMRGFLSDPEFARIVDADLRDGQHRNPTSNADYFTTAFFHTPAELRSEIIEAGWRPDALIAVEGPAAYATIPRPRRREPVSLERSLALIERIEAEPSLLGASPHWLAIGR
jgi:ubiquinone/menaquinone biosynthesis C-methylase UbiE